MPNHPNRSRRTAGLLRRRSLDGTYCRDCSGRMFIDEASASHHGSAKDISYDDDADHVAVAEEEPE